MRRLRLRRPAASSPRSSLTDERRIELFLRNNTLAGQSIAALRPEFPRWVRYLHEQGVDEIPDSTFHPDGHGVNLLCLLIRQGTAVRDAGIEHELRNVTGVRPYKL